MNKCMSNLIVVALVLLMPCLAFALPGAHDPASGNGYSCNTCHVAPATYGNTDPTYTTNVCFTCHNSAKVRTNKAFLPTDFADIDNTSAAIAGRPVTTSTRQQSSHKWFGPDNNATAKALSPTDTGVNGLTKTGVGYSSSLACVRCHAVHGTSGAESNNAPYLRAVNDKDQLCLNCHRPRDTQSHITGTHPVNVSYTSASVKAKAAAGQFYLVNGEPVKNVTNPTAEMKNKQNSVVCSSCHGVHVADSNSATLDNYSSSNNGILTPADGSLLRVSKRGANNAVATINICTNCHIKTHSGQTQQHTKSASIQCMDCHSAHVDDTDPINPTPNQYLLRRFVNWSGVKNSVVQLTSYRKRLEYTTDVSTAKWSNSSGTGVCQACHALPNSVSQHTNYTLNRTDCIGCHANAPHTDTAPVGGCDTCHGYPPQHTTGGAGSNGYAINGAKNYFSSGVYKNESTAGHPTHAAGKPNSYSCDQCHQTNTHDSGTFQDVFIGKTGIIANTAGGATPAPNPAYTAGTGTCATMYCHSNGVSRAGGTAKYKTVTWSSIRNSIAGTANECIACHNGVKTAGFNNMSTGSHFKHVSNLAASGKGYTCNYCHSGTVSSNTVVSNASAHANGTAEVTLTGVYNGLSVNGTWATGPATCSTSYCHSNGSGVYATPTWTTRSSGQCDSCHKTANNVSGILSSGAHFTHISSSFGPKLNNNTLCNNCHVYTSELGTTHVDGSISKNAGATWCQNCHGMAEPAGTTTWSGSVSVSCESCHSGRGNGLIDNPANTSWSAYNASGVRAPFKGYTTFTNRGHGKGATYNTCQSCHDNKSKHITGVLGDSNRLLTGLGSGSTGAECAFCHNDALKVTNSVFRGMSSHLGIGSTRIGGGGNNYSTRSLCDVCHDPHGSKNAAMIRTFVSFGTAAGFGNLTATISFNTKTGRADYVQTAPPYRGLCQVCHTKTTTFKRNSAVVAHNGSSDCLGCHNHIGKSYAFQPTGSCGSCHGYPPTKPGFVGTTANYANYKSEDYTGGGGAHTVPGHIPATAVESQAWANCDSCHPSTSHNGGGTPPKIQFVNVTTQDAYRFNASKAPSYTGDHTTTVGSCNNVSCHFKQSPAWNRP